MSQTGTDQPGSLLAQATAREESASSTLTEVARKTHAGKVLVVAEATGGTLVLCRERTKTVEGTEVTALKRTSALADFAHAVEAGLL